MTESLDNIILEADKPYSLPSDVFGANVSQEDIEDKSSHSTTTHSPRSSASHSISSIGYSSSNDAFDPETHSIDEISSNNGSNTKIDLDAYEQCLDVITDPDNVDGDEFPETIIDKDEMMETSDDQDILGSPHSSFSYDDTLSEHEIDGLTNYNIILEYPQLTFENIQLLPFIDELNDWFSYKDLKHLKTISQLSSNITVENNLKPLRDKIIDLYDNGNLQPKSYGQLLQYLLQLSYLAMGSFNDAIDQLDIKTQIFSNISQFLKCDGLMEIIIDIILFNAYNLSDCSNLESTVNLVRQKLMSNHFFFSLTILYIALLSYNTEELNGYEEKIKLSKIISEKDLMIGLLKAIDRWKWLSTNSENDDPTVIVESINSKANDAEKRQILAVTQFKIRNVLALFNNLILFQFGNLEHIESTKEFLKFKHESPVSKQTKFEKTTDKSDNSSPNNPDNSEENDRSDGSTNNDDKAYNITSLDYEYYINELKCRYPTYAPPKYETSDIMEIIVKNENLERVSELINADSLLINQHHHLKNNKYNMGPFSNDPPEIHIATPMPSPTLTPQHTGNTRNCSNISEYEHTSNEIKKKLYITQSNFPNIFPLNNNLPKSIEAATDIFYHHVHDDFNTKQFTSTFENFILKENGYEKDKFKDHSKDFIYSEKDIKENPMFVEELRSLINVEEFYKKGIPYFNSLIFIILKLLISNIIPTQQTAENGKTRQRTTYGSKSNDDNKPYMSENLSTFEKQKLEITRMKETMLKTGSTIILMLQKWFKLSHILKFEYFTTLLFDQDFLIYLFRYLDSNKIQAHSGKDFDFKETKSLINNRIVYCDYKVLYYLEDYNFFIKCLKLSHNPHKEFETFDEQADFDSIFDTVENNEAVNPLSFILPFVPHNQVFTIVNPNKRCCILMTNLLQSLYYTVSHFKIQRIYKLIGVRPTEILRFYLTLHNPLFYLPILKTVKLLSPFIGKKWRANNMDLISFVYLFHRIGLKDPWLNNFFNVGVEENTKRGFDNEVSLRSMIKFYNFEYYGDELNKHGFSGDVKEFMNEVEKLNGDFFAKECFDVDI